MEHVTNAKSTNENADGENQIKSNAGDMMATDKCQNNIVELSARNIGQVDQDDESFNFSAPYEQKSNHSDRDEVEKDQHKNKLDAH